MAEMYCALLENSSDNLLCEENCHIMSLGMFEINDYRQKYFQVIVTFYQKLFAS